MADAGTRAGLIDELALEQMLGTAYDTASVPVTGPFNAVFDRFELGFAALHQCHGKAKLYGGLDTSDVHLQLADWQSDAAMLVDAMWHGSIIARSTPDDSRIESLAVRLPGLGAIDAAVAADNGGDLPEDAVVLEQARKAELAEQLQTGLESPEAISEAVVDRLLSDMGLASVEALLRNGAGTPASVTVGFSPAANVPPAARSYPVQVALLIHDAGFSVRDLLLHSKLLRTRLRDTCSETEAPAGLPRLRSLLVAWVVPAEEFEDEDWPGAAGGMNAEQARAARRASAGQWLASEGIGLIVTGA
jgi:hypothetical protein